MGEREGPRAVDDVDAAIAYGRSALATCVRVLSAGEISDRGLRGREASRSRIAHRVAVIVELERELATSSPSGVTLAQDLFETLRGGT